MRKLTRIGWWLLAYASLGLGFIGIFLPGLPTVPFVLLSGVLMLLLMPNRWMALPGIVVMAIVGTWLWHRPEPPASA